jgi:uncharacterized protein YecT (DUF1311 family)
MPADEPRGAPSPGLIPGFHSYADDTPWDAELRRPDLEARSWDEPIPIGRREVYERPVQPRRGRAWPMFAVGAGVLAAFGAGFLLARTDGPSRVADRPAVAEAATAPATEPMRVEVAEPTLPAPPPPPTSSAKLEVLPGDMPPPVALARRPPPILSIAPRIEFRPPQPPRELAMAPAPRDAVATTAPVAPTATPAPAPVRTSYDCRDAPTLARAMVCRDAGLAAMDRRMKQAYAAAVAAGAPEDELRADQEDWLAIREEAARVSRRSVTNIYSQRIDELRAIADRRWR